MKDDIKKTVSGDKLEAGIGFELCHDCEGRFECPTYNNLEKRGIMEAALAELDIQGRNTAVFAFSPEVIKLSNVPFNKREVYRDITKGKVHCFEIKNNTCTQVEVDVRDWMFAHQNWT